MLLNISIIKQGQGELAPQGPLHTDISLPDTVTCPGLSREPGLEDKIMEVPQPETTDRLGSARGAMLLTGWCQ